MRITRLLFIILAMAMLHSAGAQSINQRFGNNLSRGYYTFGLNAGWAYQSSDVRAASGGYGLGATLAKNLYYRNGAALAFDLRGRLLFARTYGLGLSRAYDIANNSALNGDRVLDYTTYPANLEEPQGFVFHNHRTDIFELGLEGVLTFNRLRERTGFVFSLFGGIGADWYRAKIDQANSNGQAYFEDYAAIKSNFGDALTRERLKSVLDKTYETTADGFDGNLGKIGLMPSAGLEIGYQLSQRFSVHLGHRVTFSGTNILDGNRWADTQNDLYHYTNFAMRWIIQPRRDKPLAPVIEITTPITNPYTTNNPNDGIVRAIIRNINSAADVESFVNGRQERFDYDNQRFTTEFQLRPGRNDIVITARNQVGTARKEVTIYYEDRIIGPPPPPPAGRAPGITITNPPTRNYRTSNANFTIRASVQEVFNKNDITLEYNGNTRQSFYFDSSTGELYTDVVLREGENRIYIRARNSYGDASEDASVIYQREALPLVSITRPDRERTETQQPTAIIEADVRGVNRQQDVTMVVNGRQFRNFSFDVSREQLRAEVSLEQGANYIEINASNAAGQSKDGVTITYSRQVSQLRPTVVITDPSKPSSSTSKSSAPIEATTQNVAQKSDVRFFVNGRETTNFNFSNNTGRISSTVSLESGSNEVRIRVSNRDGEAEASVSIRRIGDDISLPQAPRVSISQPADGASFDQPRVDFRAKTERVSSKENVTFSFNGRNISDFNFNRLSGEITASLTLTEGNNVARIVVRNEAGTDEATSNVRYKTAAAKPEVSISQPANNSTASTQEVSLKATTRNVSAKSEITMTFNGRTANNFAFDAGRQEITSTLNLEGGNNVVTIKVSNSGGQAEATANVRYNPAKPPVVDITAPNTADYTSSDRSYTVRATIQHVNNKGDISVKVNGQPQNNFTFSTSSGELSLPLTLAEGQTTVAISARNSAGSDEASVRIRYAAPQLPEVKINQPQNKATVTSPNVTLEASVRFISDKKGVTIKVNGKSLATFDLRNESLSAAINGLKKGSNRIEVTAQNRDGSASDAITVVYEPTVAVAKPEVRFVQPSRAGTSSRSATADIVAEVKNVSAKTDLLLKINGVATENFNFDAKGSKLTATISLTSGTNAIEIEASNSAGSAKANTDIRYQGATEPGPSVKIASVSQPTTNPLNPNVGRSTVVANIDRVSSKNQITFTVNGRRISDFNFNPKTGSFDCTFELERGANNIVLRAETPNGADEETRSINF